MKFTRTSLLLLGLIATLFLSCKNNTENKADVTTTEDLSENDELFFKISLAQWSLHKELFEGNLDPMDFAEKASEMGFEGIEYVTTFYAQRLKDAEDPKAAMQDLLDSLQSKSEEFGVENVLIMVDGEGNLASNSEEERNQAVENHKKWVDAADFLGAHAIRVNLFGTSDPEEWKTNSIDGLTKLSEYAATKDINVLVENHGGFSSNASLLAEVMEGVNLENTGTLPDFGNFCITRADGGCAEEYPKYQGIEEMLPYAKSVSAKSHDFDEEGQETNLDYARILKMVKDAGFTGYIGVEYEGSRLSEEEGIIATKELLIAEGSKLN